MSESPTEELDERESGNWKLSLLASVVILGAAGSLAALTFFTEPTAKRGGATKKTAMLVEVTSVERGNFRPQLVAQGTVTPARDVVMRPQVDGRIVSLGSDFTPGGHVDEGDLLVRIESADYRNALAQRKSELREAETALALEQGRQEAAQSEYKYLDEDLSEKNKALVLRKPQLEAAKERVAAAKAAVEQARLNVRRTRVEAPFDAHIIRRDVNVGSQVSTSDSIGRLVGVDTYWVSLELPLSKLRWISVPEDDEAGSRVRVRNQQAWPKDTFREGELFKMVGSLDENTRMARVIAAVADPLALEDESDGQPPLMIGEFVEATIDGNELKDVVRINRDYIREDDTVWVMVDDKLQVKDVEILVQDSRYAYVSSGIEDGAQVVMTNISTVVEGAPLRLEGEQEAPADEDEGSGDE